MYYDYSDTSEILGYTLLSGDLRATEVRHDLVLEACTEGKIRLGRRCVPDRGKRAPLVSVFRRLYACAPVSGFGVAAGTAGNSHVAQRCIPRGLTPFLVGQLPTPNSCRGGHGPGQRCLRLALRSMKATRSQPTFSRSIQS